MQIGWRDYQDQAAEFFRSLGFEAQTNVPVEGARGKHDIDVLVTFEQLGLKVLWVVECKLWKSAVSKEKVLVLHQIAQDVGADRAFLLSEKGFQSGAIRCTKNTNITLTSLDDLRTNAREFVLQVRLSNVAQRFTSLSEEVNGWMIDNNGRPSPPLGSTFNQVLAVAADLFLLRINFPHAMAGQFPISLPNVYSHGHVDHVSVNSLSEFVDCAERIISNTEKRTEELKQRASEIRPKVCVAIEAFEAAVAALLADGEVALFDVPEDDSVRKRVVARMRSVGLAADALKEIADRPVVDRLGNVMRLLIDTIYEYLAHPTVEVALWRAARDAMKEAVAGLTTVGSLEQT